MTSIEQATQAAVFDVPGGGVPGTGAQLADGFADGAPQSVPDAAFGMGLVELEALMARHGQKVYRAKQLFQALYRQRAAAWDGIAVLPAELRRALAGEGVSVGLPELVQTARSVDGTERYLVRMADGETVETVWMPDGDGGRARRWERGRGGRGEPERSQEIR